jgi:hypothetical protein
VKKVLGRNEVLKNRSQLLVNSNLTHVIIKRRSKWLKHLTQVHYVSHGFKSHHRISIMVKNCMYIRRQCVLHKKANGDADIANISKKNVSHSGTRKIGNFQIKFNHLNGSHKKASYLT